SAENGFSRIPSWVKSRDMVEMVPRRDLRRHGMWAWVSPASASYTGRLSASVGAAGEPGPFRGDVTAQRPAHHMAILSSSADHRCRGSWRRSQLQTSSEALAR